ncbi:hypothetical protein D3C84_479870 [compost metagenome]
MGIQAVAGFAQFAFEGFKACRKLANLQLFGGGQSQLIRAARLDQIIGGTGLDGVDGGVHG